MILSCQLSDNFLCVLKCFHLKLNFISGSFIDDVVLFNLQGTLSLPHWQELYYITLPSLCQALFEAFQTLFRARRRFDSLIIIPHPEALVNIFFQDLFKPLSRFGIFCILSHPSFSVKTFFFLLTSRSLRDSSSILPYISLVVNCFFHNFQLFFLFFGFFCPIPTFSTTFHTYSTDLSTDLPHIDTLTPI